MTEKQALIIKLNELRAELYGLPALTEKKIAKMAIGVVKNNIEMYEKEKAGA